MNDPRQTGTDYPREVQLRRIKGWRLPPNTVVVARPSRWGNPFKVGVDGSAEECVAKYERHIATNPDLAEAAAHDLRGFNLACYCPIGAPCHRRVLLQIANG